MSKDFINILVVIRFEMPFLYIWQYLQALFNVQFLTCTRPKNNFETSLLTLLPSAQDTATVLV